MQTLLYRLSVVVFQVTVFRGDAMRYVWGVTLCYSLKHLHHNLSSSSQFQVLIPIVFIPFLPIFIKIGSLLFSTRNTPCIPIQSMHPIPRFYLLDSRPRRTRTGCGLLGSLTPEPLIVNDAIPPLHLGHSQMFIFFSFVAQIPLPHSS